VIYLLDTNIVSDLVRNPSGLVAAALTAKQADPGSVIVTSIVVVCESRFGVRRKGSRRLEEQVEEVLSQITILPLGDGVDLHYAEARLQLEREGRPIGANDLLIAAHTLALGAVLVTDNVREFERVKGLQLENWLRA
jgi:tRNA(fMet)-specific endonuclease VapC